MSYACKVLADSVGPHGIRLTTLEVTFPRPYLAELNTHRMLSRNSESSRAIPTEMQLDRIYRDPYIPEFRERAKGMGGGEFLAGDDYRRARNVWLSARDEAASRAEALLEVAKDDANRLLEPFMWHTAIISATDWDNFLNLRDHEAAAVPMQRLAQMVRSVLKDSKPQRLKYGEWHLPMVAADESSRDDAALISAGRCARSSYSTHRNPETPEESAERWDRLGTAGHWSPAEHPAMCVDDMGYMGNFRGFKQLRKFYDNEAVFDG